MRDRKEIISVSLDADQLRELERLRASGRAARSQVVRAALREHFARMQAEPDGAGACDAVVLCLYRHDGYDEVSQRVRSSGGRVKTMVHSHAGEGCCLDLCHIEGPARLLNDLVHELRGLDGVRSVQLVLLPRPAQPDLLPAPGTYEA